MYLVFDLGGTIIKYCLMNRDGQIIDEVCEFQAKQINDLSIFITKIQAIYLSYSNIDGIAFSSPGVIDATNGIVKIIAAHPYLQGVCLSKQVSKACNNVKVTVENDAKCAALAECYQGNGVNYQDMMVIALGTGIGGALIKNKRIHNGANLFAGEVSTVILNYDKETKKTITWSDLCSTTALCLRVATAKGIDNINGYQVFEMANSHDEVVLAVLKDYCLDIALQLYNFQYLYDPEIILIGGGISKQPILLQTIQDCIDEIDANTNQLIKPKVAVCKFYNNANLIGALYHFLTI